jgi:hypothetical protein
MPVPYMGGAVSSAGGPRKYRGKEAEKEEESYQQQPHVQMQFNYYHYGMGTSQSPSTPEAVSFSDLLL